MTNSETSSFFFAGNDDFSGVQIDMLIDRNDAVINLCEIKFYNDQFILTKAYADKLRQKRSVFKAVSKTKKQVFITLISTFGVLENKHSTSLIDNQVGLDALFNVVS